MTQRLKHYQSSVLSSIYSFQSPPPPHFCSVRSIGILGMLTLKRLWFYYKFRTENQMWFEKCLKIWNIQFLWGPLQVEQASLNSTLFSRRNLLSTCSFNIILQQFLHMQLRRVPFVLILVKALIIAIVWGLNFSNY